MHGTRDDKYWLDKELQNKAIRLLYRHERIVGDIRATASGHELEDMLNGRAIEGCNAGFIDELGRAIESSYWKTNKEVAATAIELRQMIDEVLSCRTDEEKLKQVEMLKEQIKAFEGRHKPQS